MKPKPTSQCKQDAADPATPTPDAAPCKASKLATEQERTRLEIERMLREDEVPW